MIVPRSIGGKLPGSASILFLSLFAFLQSAFAVDPDRTLAQLYHTAWTIEDGAPSSIYRLAQTKDGYLWLGTFNGLFRFDGVRFERYQPERGDPFPSQNVLALQATPDGGLWVALQPYGAAFIEHGRGHSYGQKEGLPLAGINMLALDREGAVWAATNRGLFRFSRSHWEEIGSEWGFPTEGTDSLFVDRQARLWVQAGADLYCLLPGAHVFQKRKMAHDWRINQSPDGTLWLWEFGVGVRAVYGQLANFTGTSKTVLGPELFLRFVDREGGLWMSSPHRDGVHRISNPAKLPSGRIAPNSDLIQRFTHRDGLTSDFINDAIEDAEGNIWIATTGGLDRFRRKEIVQGPFPAPTGAYAPLLITDQKGNVWEGSAQSLTTVTSGSESELGPRIATTALSGRWQEVTAGWWDFEEALWIGGKGTLTRSMGSRLETIQFPGKDLAGHWDVQSITSSRSGDLWVSIQQHGVYRRRTGAWAEYGALPGLPKTTAVFLWTDSKDRIWFAYMGNQIALLDGDRVRMFSATDGLHVGNVLTIGGRGDHIWAAGQFGLALFDGNKFHTIAGEADSDFRGISGVVEIANGDFWLNMATGVARISSAEVANRLRDARHKLQYDLLNFRDGVRGTPSPIRPLPTAVQTADGRVWLADYSGVYWIDPAHLSKNPILPPVTVEAIYEGDQRFSAFEPLRLSKLPENVRIEYTALSLSIPERVRFRYQLEGYDKNWQDAGTRRAAFYTKLPPGHFRFHVIACNNDGVWNQAGAFADIVVPPAFYQTAWFEALCGFAGLALLWGLYRYRLHQIAHEFSLRLEERVNERTRLARDLHDTLLQSFHGLMLRLQVVDKLLPEGKAKEQLEKTMERADQAIAEGRSAVYDLRSSATTTNDLSEALNAVGNEFSGDGAAAFNLTVEGQVRDLHPIIRDEVYRISREALSNAFKHAHARHIETEISYGPQAFRVRIRDDGQGIPAEFLEQGPPGHYGITGIRERAKQIRAELTIWSRQGNGTEIDLSLASTIAYSASPRRSAKRKGDEK